MENIGEKLELGKLRNIAEKKVRENVLNFNVHLGFKTILSLLSVGLLQNTPRHVCPT